MTTQRIAELEAEVMRLRDALEKSRGALAYCKGNGRDNPNLMESTCWHGLATVEKALSTPFTPTALNELIEKVEQRTIERCISCDDIGDRALWGDEVVALIRALPVGQIKLEDLLK